MRAESRTMYRGEGGRRVEGVEGPFGPRDGIPPTCAGEQRNYGTALVVTSLTRDWDRTFRGASRRIEGCPGDFDCPESCIGVLRPAKRCKQNQQNYKDSISNNWNQLSKPSQSAVARGRRRTRPDAAFVFCCESKGGSCSNPTTANPSPSAELHNLISGA